MVHSREPRTLETPQTQSLLTVHVTVMHADNVEYKVQTIATVSAVGTGASEKRDELNYRHLRFKLHNTMCTVIEL